MNSLPPSGRDRIFISYSHNDEDREYLEKLRKMLKPLIRKQTITVWDDTQIEPGSKWRNEIENALAMAKVAVLMVSSNFLDSDFIVDHELPSLLQAAEKKGLKIIWIYISPCLYQETEIEKYQAAHDISRPLADLKETEQHQVLVEICQKIKQAFEDKNFNEYNSQRPKFQEIYSGIRQFLSKISPILKQEVFTRPRDAIGKILNLMHRPNSNSEFKDYDHEVKDDDSKILHKRLNYQVRFATRNDLDAVAELDLVAYGDYTIDRRGLEKWWKQYEHGIYVLTQESKIIGAIGIWPISQRTFKQVTEGKIDEQAIQVHKILKIFKARHKYWYFGDIVLDKEFQRKTIPLITLLDGTLRSWLWQEELDDDIELCAIAATDEGAKLLKKYNFECELETPDQKKIYVYKSSLKKLKKKYLERIKQKDNSKSENHHLLRLFLAAALVSILLKIFYLPFIQSYLQNYFNMKYFKIEVLIFIFISGWAIGDPNSERRKLIRIPLIALIVAIIQTLK
jgi:hypothetical protein